MSATVMATAERGLRSANDPSSFYIQGPRENLSATLRTSLHAHGGTSPSKKSLQLTESSKIPTPRRSQDVSTQHDGIELARMGGHTDTRQSSSLPLKPEGRGEMGAEAIPAFNMSIKDERIYLAVLCWCLFLAGWNDGTLGPLLPRIQAHYELNFLVVSMLFVSGCVGFIGGAVGNVHLSDRLGFGKVVVLGAGLQVIAYSMQAPAPPFAVMCVAYVINGFGGALQDAQANAFIASIPRHQSTNMGILHAVYGLGAFSAPLVSTQFAQLPRWSFNYLVSLGISFTNMAALIWTFKLKRQDHFIPDTHGSGAQTKEQPQENTFKQIFGQKAVHALAFFIFVYVGVEVTLGGWTVTYIITERGGGPSSGYVASGFFGGLTLGRVALLWVNKKIGERHVIYLYTLICIALEITIWFVPNLIENAVAVSIIGVALGPFYPIAMNIAAAILPRKLLAGSIGWIAGFGQAGSAVLPFMTGALAQKHGVKVLQPLLVAMMALMMGLWFFVTRHKLARRID